MQVNLFIQVKTSRLGGTKWNPTETKIVALGYAPLHPTYKYFLSRSHAPPLLASKQNPVSPFVGNNAVLLPCYASCQERALRKIQYIYLRVPK
jgi:hypothetical protein